MQVSRHSVRRACDACRRRKVKCDAEHPCANCRITHLECTYTIPQRKRGPKTFPGASSPRCSAPSTLTSVPSHEPRSPDTTSNGNSSPSQAFTSLLSPADVNTTPDATASPNVFHSIQEALLLSLQSAIPSPLDALAVVNRCIDLYMQYTFPALPLVHEPTLRTYTELFFANPCTTTCYESKDERERVALLRGFALTTALCASIASVMPDMLNPRGQALVEPFLHASSEALRSFEKYDLEHPSSASMTIRLFHSTALQHTTGKNGASRHVQGQAALIACSLRLHREQTLEQVDDPIERLLLRLIFWFLYASDQAAAAFQMRGFILDESLFQEPLTLQSNIELETPLMDPNQPQYSVIFECRLLTGFYLFRSVSCSAANIILRMRRHGSVPSETDKRLLTQEYLRYIGLMDDMPDWLRISYLAASDGDDETEKLCKSSFWVQRCTILTAYHSLRLIILRQCIQNRMCNCLGLSDNPFGLAMKSIEMVSDILQVLQDIPLIYLQVKGEPTVERIRQVGGILLELMHTVGDETMKTCAQAYCRRLLDILVALNSKTSDSFTLEA